MKNRVVTLLKHPLISGASIIFFGTFFANIFNFLFNVFMSRNLSVADYGLFASLVSIVLLCALFAESFLPTVVHFSAGYFANGEMAKVKALFWKLTKLLFLFAAIFAILLNLFNKPIGDFFKIYNNEFIIFLVSIIVFLNFIGIVNRSMLQAKLSFGYITFLQVFSSLLKLIVGLFLVMIGYKVYGAIWGFLAGGTLLYLLTFFPLKSFFTGKMGRSEVTIKQILIYGGPSAVALLSVTSFITTDLMLVKHFYSSVDAGIYAGLSLLGRIIYFFTSPIALVMFPLIVQRKTKAEKYSHLFTMSFLLILLSSLAITIFYYIFPEASIRVLLKNDEYLVVKPILGFFGIYMSIFCLFSLTVNFFLSTKRTFVAIPVLAGAILQLILLWFYHESFIQVITISITIISLLLAFLLLYYVKLYGVFSKR